MPEPEFDRPDPPLIGGERATLLGFLDYLRGTIAVKTGGFDAPQLATTLPPSTMTLGGMLVHLAFVEDYWLRSVWLGLEPSPPWDTAPWNSDADWDWHLAERLGPDELREIWRDAVRRSRTIVAESPALDACSADGTTSLRWILTHLIEEYARHAGHADLIAQSLDGRTGE